MNLRSDRSTSTSVRVTGYAILWALIGCFDGLAPSDFGKLRADLAKGKDRMKGATTLKGDIGRARMVFLFALKEGFSEKPILYRKSLRAPSQRILRRHQQERGPLMIESDDLRHLLKSAGPQVRAMIYLGINCGFGNTDCATCH